MASVGYDTVKQAAHYVRELGRHQDTVVAVVVVVVVVEVVVVVVVVVVVRTRESIVSHSVHGKARKRQLHTVVLPLLSLASGYPKISFTH